MTATRLAWNCYARPFIAVTWAEYPLDPGEQALADIADWGPAEDWSDWANATR